MLMQSCVVSRINFLKLFLFINTVIIQVLYIEETKQIKMSNKNKTKSSNKSRQLKIEVSSYYK